MQMPGRTLTTSNYRFGYNGMEKDPEQKGDGNSYTTEFRQYDPRLGRWMSLDPLASVEPAWSPYRAFFDNPIAYTDPSGLFETKKEAREHRQKQRDEGYTCSKILLDKQGNYYYKSKFVYSTGDCFGTKNIYGDPKGPSLAFIGATPIIKDLFGVDRTSTAIQTAVKHTPKPALHFLLRGGVLLAPAFLLSGDEGPKYKRVDETSHFILYQMNDHVQFQPKPGVKLSPAVQQTLNSVNFLSFRNEGRKTDVYVGLARSTGKYYPCKSCTVDKASLVELRKNEIYKFGISHNPLDRYSGNEKKFMKTQTIIEDVSRDLARALEKIFIIEYTLGGYNNQRGALEQRGINTTYGKPIGNPYFR